MLILYVGTSETICRLIRQTSREHSVIMTYDEEEIRHILDLHQGNILVLLDLDISKIDGVHLLRRLKSTKAYMNIPIIILTNPDNLDKEIEGLVLGATDYIRRPIHMYSLRTRLKNHIKGLETVIALAESERSKSAFLSHLPGMAYRCDYDPHWTMQYVSAGCFALTGYTSKNLLYNRDISYNSLIAPEYREHLWKKWEGILDEGSLFRDEYEIITARGERKWVLEVGQGVYGEEGNVEALEGIILDISDRKAFEMDLRYSSEHDLWTGLHNRRSLVQLLEQDIQKDTDEKKALVGINLSTMHQLTMTYGFHYSQELTKKVADALKPHATDSHLLFCTNESRFVFYVMGYKTKADLVEFGELIIDSLEPILDIERVGGGIGIIEMDGLCGYNVEDILKNLLIASERIINISNKDLDICFFDKDMENKVNREEMIVDELTQISTYRDDERLFLDFQPILDLKSNQICSFEALARIKSHRLGSISPLEFIPLAEKTKLIIPLGKQIIYKALCFLKTLENYGYNQINISINISVIQLVRKDFMGSLCSLIKEMGVNPNNIILEITESVFALEFDNINHTIDRFRKRGIKIALDDFGTGYSSLAQERELKLDYLKIDKYFIDKLLFTKEEESITGDIISMAHRRGHKVVAEGVEKEGQRNYLEKYGCDKIQGYLISKPINIQEALKCLKSDIGCV